MSKMLFKDVTDLYKEFGVDSNLIGKVCDLYEKNRNFIQKQKISEVKRKMSEWEHPELVDIEDEGLIEHNLEADSNNNLEELRKELKEETGLELSFDDFGFLLVCAIFSTELQDIEEENVLKVLRLLKQEHHKPDYSSFSI